MKFVKTLIDLMFKKNIRNKIASTFILMLLFTILFFSVISYFWFSQYSLNSKISEKINISKTASGEVAQYIKNVESIGKMILIDGFLLGELEKHEPTIPQSYSDIQLNDKIISILKGMTYFEQIKKIYIAGYNGAEYVSHPYDMQTFDGQFFEKYPRFLELVKQQGLLGKSSWIVMKENIFSSGSGDDENSPYIYIVREIVNPSNIGRKLGISVFQLSHTRINDIIKTYPSYNGEYAILCNNEGIILGHTQSKDLIGSKIDQSILDKISKSPEGRFYEHYEGRQFLMTHITDPKYGWTIVQAVPYQNITDDITEIRNFSIVFGLLMLILVLGFSLYLSRGITKPLVSLIRTIKQFSKGDLTQRAEIQSGEEIGTLSETFNKMAERINLLMGSLEEEYKQKQVLEISVLESQINPHFLYNTLDMINWMARKSKNPDIEKMVVSLANYYRISLSKGNTQITLGEEIEHARNYLIILENRNKGLFEYAIHCPEELKQYKVLKVILQPIIENAIKYGMNREETNNFISIVCAHEGNMLKISVIDNGKGITPEKLIEISSGFNNGDAYGKGFGLKNVDRRIKIAFGSEYGLCIESMVNVGTNVTITVPAI